MSAPTQPLTIWCNAKFTEPATKLLIEGTRAHKLVMSAGPASVLEAGKDDAGIASADIAFGQPDPKQCLGSKRIKWVEVTSAGYTRYDTPEFLEGFRGRGLPFTNMSGVFFEPCAEHVMAMMLALARQLPYAHRDQVTDHEWRYTERRYASQLLVGQTVLMLGFGAIGRRLAELLAPYKMKLIAVRRQTKSEAGVRVIPEEAVSSALAEADHVVNILPDNASTQNFMNARRFACMKAGARFYNIGRGTTVDERALLDALQSRRLDAAYLDVFATEPLPPESPLWTAPNCFITPHTAGGRSDQDEAIVQHFLDNLAAFTAGNQPKMTDRVV